MDAPLVFAGKIKKHFFKSLVLFGALCFSVPCTSCTAATQPEGQKKFGNDADYFIGLRLLSEGNENAAREKFRRCIKKGSPRCAERSAEALCTFGNLQEKNAAAENLIKLFPNEDALLIAARQFSVSGSILTIGARRILLFPRFRHSHTTVSTGAFLSRQIFHLSSLMNVIVLSVGTVERFLNILSDISLD